MAAQAIIAIWFIVLLAFGKCFLFVLSPGFYDFMMMVLCLFKLHSFHSAEFGMDV